MRVKSNCKMHWDGQSDKVPIYKDGVEEKRSRGTHSAPSNGNLSTAGIVAVLITPLLSIDREHSGTQRRGLGLRQHHRCQGIIYPWVCADLWHSNRVDHNCEGISEL